MRDWPETLLSETYATVVAAQIDYGATRGVPWGVSESAFNAKDAQLTYQYQAFGVPGLGLKRGLSDDVVVAPYASIIALPIDPRAVITNLAAFSAEGAEGRFGYYEALDYTAGPRTGRPAPRGRRELLRAPPGHGVHRAGQRAVRRPHAGALPRGPDGRLGRAAAPGAAAAPHPARHATRRGGRERALGARAAAARHALVQHRRHARARDALPVQRPLLGHGHQRRRRLLALERDGGHPLPRGRHARLLGHVLLRARHRERRGLLGAAQPAPEPAGPLQRHLRARQGRVPPPRRRPRDARRGLGLARGRCRDPPHHAFQPRPDRAQARGHELLRDLPDGAGFRPVAQVVLEPVRRDRVAARDQRRALHAPAAQLRRGALLGIAPARVRARGRRVPGQLRDRPRRLHRPAPRCRRPGRHRARRRAVVHARPGARPVLRAAPLGHGAGRRERAPRLRDRRLHRPRDRAAPHREVPRHAQRPARDRPGVDRRPARAARPGHQPAGGGHARAPRLAPRADRPVLAAQAQDPRRERPADVGPVVDRHQRRPADPARARRGARARTARAPGASRPPVLAAQGA